MLAGELYHGWDPELVRERARTRGLLNRYNASGPDDAEGRRAILGALLANIGEGAWVEPPFSCDYGWNISLGERAYLNFGCVLLDCAPIKIGPLTKPFRAFNSTLLGVPAPAASNNWVVGPSRSSHGKPMLASDPHVPFGLPSVWYEAHLRGGDLRIEWPEGGSVRMTGPAVTVYDGVWPLPA